MRTEDSSSGREVECIEPAVAQHFVPNSVRTQYCCSTQETPVRAVSFRRGHAVSAKVGNVRRTNLRGVQSHSRVRRASLGAILALGAVVVVPGLVSAASSPKPSISSFKATSLLPPQGGTLTLSAVVSNGGTCTYSVTPKFAGFPMTLDCTPTQGTSQRSQHVAVALPSNATGAAIHYSWSLVVRTASASAKWGKPVKTDLESFHISRQQFAANLKETPLAISCSSPSFCMTVGKLGNAAILSGTIVQRFSSLDGGHSLTDVSCASSKMCVVIDNAGNFLVWDGAHMSGANPLYEGGTTTRASVTSVSCPVASFCMNVGDSGEAFTISGTQSSDRTAAGHAWNNKPRYVSCSSSTSCVVADHSGEGYTWDGKSWSTPLLISAAGVGPISCPTGTNVCVAIDRAGYGWLLQPPVPTGGSWYLRKKMPGKMKSGQLVITRLSCPSNVYCLAVDGTGGTNQIIGGSIGPRIAPSGNVPMIGPSCAIGGTPKAVTCTSVAADGKHRYIGTVTIVK